MPYLELSRTYTQRASRTVGRQTRSGAVSYEIIGPRGAPVIVVLGGISATRHVAANAADPAPGWWDSMVGAGRAIDTTRFRVLGVDFLDGGRRTDGQPQRIVTTHDQAAAVVSVLDTLRIAGIHTFVGASYGGMVALAFADWYRERVNRLVVISAPHESHPMSTALRALQRRIVRLGLETDRPAEALAIARGLAMTTYRSAEEFAERFAASPVARTRNDATFPVERYLQSQGDRFAATWTGGAERFLALSLSADLHRVEPSSILVPSLIVAAENDAIVPREQLAVLAAGLGAPSTLADLQSTRGHDAFLTEPAALGRILDSVFTDPSCTPERTGPEALS